MRSVESQRQESHCPEYHVMTAVYVQSAVAKQYHKTSYISRTIVENIIVDNSDVVGAVPTMD